MKALASYLDAAILKPDMTEEEVMAAVALCLPYKPCTFCVRPVDIPLVKPVCQAHRIGLCVVLGFPHGSQLTESKVDEVKRYLEMGVDEVDMVCNVGWVRAGKWKEVKADIAAVSAFTRPAGVPLKVIFETCFLGEAEIKRLVSVSIEANADFVKTSTGFNGQGAQDLHVKLMIKTADRRIQVKPSGDIQDRKRAEALIALGATRLGVHYLDVPVICEGDTVTGKPAPRQAVLPAV